MDSERLVFLSTSSHGDGVRHQIEKVLEQRSKTFNAILRQTPTIGDALVLLDDGVGDLVAMSPQNWMKHKNEKIAIVGSGPAGLSAAQQLNSVGHSVEVYERSDRIGGLMMYGIPNMKLDKSILDMRIEIMEKEGIIFHTNTDIGAPNSPSLENLINENDSVLLTTGATKPRDLAIPGREGDGVHFAMEFLGKNTKSLLDSKL